MNGIYGACLSLVQRAVFIAIALLPLQASAAPANTRTVLVLGDSLSAGYGLSAEQGWTSLTAGQISKSRPGWTLVNASISGDTTAGGASRVKGELARHHPAVLVIALGANDGLRGLDLAQMRGNLDLMVGAGKAAGAKVLLIGMRLPPNFGPQYTRAFERTYVDVAKENRVVFLPFLLEPIAADRRAFQQDNLHPIAAVQPKLRDHVWKSLGPMLTR